MNGLRSREHILGLRHPIETLTGNQSHTNVTLKLVSEDLSLLLLGDVKHLSKQSNPRSSGHEPARCDARDSAFSYFPECASSLYRPE